MGRYVRVANLTRGTSVAEHCRVASTLGERTVGLLSTPGLMRGEGLLIERTQSIHMFFMRYPIDVVFVDRLGEVTRTVSALRPWRVVWWARGARDCLELPVGALEASRTFPGDRLGMTEVA
jgi:uncharacterized membrane protein (UPF0127 family)